MFVYWNYELSFQTFIVVTLAVTVIGFIATSFAMQGQTDADPQWIVIDETAGMLIALLPLAYFLRDIDPNQFSDAREALILTFVCFALFRVLDIMKPLGIRAIDKMGGTFGVMADDLAAGLYTAVVGWVYFTIR